MVVKASVLSFTKAVASKCSVLTDIIKNMSANREIILLYMFASVIK